MTPPSKETRRPKIIVIDGPSSSGKTTLRRAFAELAPEPYASYSIDNFLPLLDSGVFAERASTDEGWVAIHEEFHAYLADLRRVYDEMIVEVMLPWPEAREDLFNRIGRDDIFYVQLYCSLEELERREHQRGDRSPGLARSQADRVYAFDGYDLRIDATRMTPQDIAQTMIRALKG